MLIVPLSRDKLLTSDSSDAYQVTSYTDLKDEPAVYVARETSDRPFITFDEVVKVNGVNVELTDGNVFKALGPLKRKFNLPQPGDYVVVELVDTDFKKEDAEVEVVALKLHKQGGQSGLRFRCRIDAKPFSSCRSPRTYKHLKGGKHTFRVYAIDSTGKQVTKATVVSWKIVPASA